MNLSDPGLGAAEVVAALGLAPHPEGGWVRRTWTSPTTVDLPDGRRRPTATVILFRLVAGETSRQKKFLVSGLTVEELRAKLTHLLATS